MLLRRLQLTAFRQFGRADVELHPGLTVISGGNGSGKSTLLEAVIWALFGRGAVRRSESSLRSTFLDATTAVRLELEADGAVHVVERTLPADAEESSASLTPALQLPDRDLFMRACFTGRRELQLLSQLDPAGRMDALARLLGNGSTHRARAHARTSNSILATAIRSMEEELESAVRRMAALEAAPDLLTQYGSELERARADLSAAERHAARLHDDWAQKRQDVQTRLDAYRRRGEELKRQIERLSAAGAGGACPTCEQALGAGVDRVVGRLDDEYYITTQDLKWLTQRLAQLERRPPDVADAETRRDRLRALVADRADRVARCEQAVQELWSVAQEKQRAQERLGELYARMPAQLSDAEVADVAGSAGAIVAAASGTWDDLELTRDGRVYGVRGRTRAQVVSGADEDLFALALRLAAARSVALRSDVGSLLLLDEPFGALDRPRRAALCSALRALQPPAHQILITTQDAELAAHADHCVSVERAADGSARVLGV